MQERRKFIRIGKSLKISYQVLETLLRGGSRSKDISEGGICLYIYEELKSGLILKLWIELEKSKKPIVAISRVVWCRKRAGIEPPFEIGIRFIQIDPQDLVKLRKYILSLSRMKRLQGAIIKWVRQLKSRS